MEPHRRPFSLAVAAVAAGLLASATVARADDKARDDARDDARVAALEARLAQLEAQQTTADRARDQSRAIDAAIVDAEQKAKFLQADGFLSGWDSGFKVGSADGNYLLQPYLELQFRNTTNYTEGSDGDAGDDDDLENGFELRRARIGFKGNAFSKDFSYNVRLAVARNSGEAILDLGYVAYQISDEWAVRLGQFKLNWTHEETTSGIRQLATERSLLNGILGGSNTSYVQGVGLLYGNNDTPLHGELTFTDGDLTANTNYTDQQEGSNYQNFGVAARAEYKFTGDWKAYEDFTALKTKQDLVVAGVGGDWAQGGDGDVYRLTADLQYENPNGLSAYGSAIYTIADGETPDADLDDSVGGLVQVSYLLPNLKDWEVFGRYNITVLDEEVSDEDTFHEATVGVNRYYFGHNAKLTLDAGWLPNGAPQSFSALGVTAGEEDQIVVRAQLQIVL